MLRLAGAAGATLLAGGVSPRDPPTALAASKLLGFPWPFPGRVIEVSHPSCIVRGEAQAAAVGAMVERGMCALAGAPDSTSAWRLFFEPGDVVGLKVNPVPSTSPSPATRWCTRW